MPLRETLEADVDKLFAGLWSIRDGRVVPDATSVTLGNDGVRIDAVVLYADLADSTVMVDSYPDWFAAEMYKAFLVCAAKVIRFEGGSITSYDGDRVMAVYIGVDRFDRAVRSAQKINWAVMNIVRPKVRDKYPMFAYEMRHVCGIDESILLAAKTGARNDNDLVWVGPAANYAAKLAAMDDAYSTYIGFGVHYNASDAVKKVGGTGADLWICELWPGRQGKVLYRSTSWWSIA